MHNTSDIMCSSVSVLLPLLRPVESVLFRNRARVYKSVNACLVPLLWLVCLSVA